MFSASPCEQHFPTTSAECTLISNTSSSRGACGSVKYTPAKFVYKQKLVKIRNYEKNRTLTDEETNTDLKSNATANTNNFEDTKNNINDQTKQNHITKKI